MTRFKACVRCGGWFTGEDYQRRCRECRRLARLRLIESLQDGHPPERWGRVGPGAYLARVHHVGAVA